jgi:predicted nucleotide-binding protein (sugar kinase/HSP70/actin superfamily)
MLRTSQKRVKKIGPKHPLFGKKIWIPRMPYGSSRIFGAVFRALGIDADCTPPSDERTAELGAKYICGDECYPTKVTLGDFLKILEKPENPPSRTVFFMPTADGPCRFGQYAPYMRTVLAEVGFCNVEIISPTSKDGYAGLGELARPFVRSGWRALVLGDILMKLLHKTRPYETETGAADQAHEDSLDDLSKVIENEEPGSAAQLQALVQGVIRARDRFRAVPARYNRRLPLVGVVGEIFCRLNTFANDDIVRRFEEYGAECWMSDIGEWVWYTNSEEVRLLRLHGEAVSTKMLGAIVRHKFQKADEHALVEPVRDDFRGYEEPHSIDEVLKCSEPYLPNYGCMGEMVLNVGKSIYLAKKGVDGVIDVSPFTCMNGIVCEAIYPRVSRDNADIPIRNFYFDGTQSDLDRDIGIYLELARTYSARKPHPRVYPSCFPPA